MSISKKIDGLFVEWRKIYTSRYFVEDDLLSEEARIRPALNVVVLLKEATEDAKNPTTEEWKYQDFIAERGYLKERGTTWPNLIDGNDLYIFDG